MDTITGIFLKREFNPVSWAIRIATPDSLFKVADSSHSIALDGNTGFALEANMLHGVRRVTIEDAIKGTTNVATIRYEVPNAEQGLQWMRRMAALRAGYDWKGAFGLGLAPDRNWQDPSKWFCYEYLAMGLSVAGRPIFQNNAHVTGKMLMALEPTYRQISWQG